MSQFKSILLAPYNFFFGENGIFASSEQQRQQKNQAFYFGLPAIVFAILGLLFLIVGELSAGKALIQRYKDDVAEIRKEETELKSTLTQELKMASGGQSNSMNSPEILELRNQLSQTLNSEQLLLNKLYALAPDEPKHLHDLALTYLTESNLAKLSTAPDKEDVAQGLKDRGISIMKRIAPLDKPGLLDAHLFLAKDALSSTVTSANEGIGNIRLATTHLDNALVRDRQNTAALGLKVLIAQKLNQREETKELLEKLFKTDLFVYPQLCTVNAQLGVEKENLAVLIGARERLIGEIARMSGTSVRRTRFQTYLVDCLHRLENLDEADKLVQTEMDDFPENERTQRWGKRLLSIGQQLRYQSRLPVTEKNAEELVGYLREGHKLDPNNIKILNQIVELGRLDIPGIEEVSKEIYRPGPKAPASVSNVLGTIALKKNDYLEAVKQFTKANAKEPNNAEYLNNLSYVYLTRPDPDPREALKLIDKAIRNIRTGTINNSFATHFYDTQGQALLALGRIAEENGDQELANSRYAAAAAKLLKALSGRPKSLDVTKVILKCYEAAGQTKQIKVWSDRVKELEAKEAQKSNEAQRVNRPNFPGQATPVP